MDANSMLDFSTLSLELLKYQEHLAARKIGIEFEWNGASAQNAFVSASAGAGANANSASGPMLDTLVIYCKPDYQKRQVRIVRSSWNQRCEFSISSTGVDRFYYRVNMITEQPVRVEKTNIYQGLWANSVPPPPDLQEFAAEVYKLICELSKQFVHHVDCHNHSLATKLID